MEKNSILLLILLFVLSSGFSQKKQKHLLFETDNPVIYDICFTHKGYALGIADNHSIKVYSTESKALLNEFENGHTKQILTIDISKDSTLLVSGGKDSTIVIWDFINKRMLHSFNYHKGIITSVKLSPDSRYLISGGSDNKVFLYDLMKNEVINEFTEHTDDIASLAFSPDNTTFASASGDHLIGIYDVNSNKMIASLKGHKSWVRDISFSLDRTKLFSCGDDSKVIIWDVSDKNNITIRKSSRQGLNWLLGIDINEDNETFVIGRIDGKVRIVSIFGNYSTRINKPINKVLFKPDEGTLLKVAVATRGKGVILIDAKDM